MNDRTTTGTKVAILVAVALALVAWDQHKEAQAARWDANYWQGETLSMYERETLGDQCCSPSDASGASCDEPIYGSDC